MNQRTSLKAKNRKLLSAIVLGNFCAFYVALQWSSVEADGLRQLVDAGWRALPTALLVILASLISGLLSSETKARIVFLRWKNPLPGSRAFSEHALNDSRIDRRDLIGVDQSVLDDEALQNATWYSIYRSLSDLPEIEESHRDYLFHRDWCAISFIGLIVLGVVAILYIDPLFVSMIYLGCLFTQYLLTLQAARNYGVRFVTNVLAIHFAREE